MQRDFILRSMNRSNAFRTFHNQIANASDLRTLIEVNQRSLSSPFAKSHQHKNVHRSEHFVRVQTRQL